MKTPDFELHFTVESIHSYTIIQSYISLYIYVCRQTVTMHLLVRSADNLFVKTTKRKTQIDFLIKTKVYYHGRRRSRVLVRRNHPEEAIRLFRRMLTSDQRPNFVTAVTVIKAVSDVELESMAGEIHGLVIKIGFEFEISVVTALLGVYSIWDMGSVWKLFGEVGYRDVVLWSAMVSTFGRKGWYKEALECFRGMQIDRHVEPNNVSVASVLPACAGLGALQFGKQIHGFCIRRELCSYKNVQNSLVDMYAKCKNLKASLGVFNRILDKDIVSWRIVIHGCIEDEHREKALSLFVSMQSASFTPDENIILETIGATLQAEQIKFGLGFHCLLLKTGYLASISIATALLQMYGKFGEVGSARTLFNYFHRKDIIAYSAMISAYAHSGDTYNAFDTLKQMQLANEKPTEITFVGLLQAFSSSAEEIGKSIQAYSTKAGYVSNTYLASVLIGLYNKCGRIRQAKLLFSETPRKDLICWSSMIKGYGINGYGTEAVETFSKMLRSGIKPNDIVFISILSACGQCGLLTEGWELFYAMKEKYGITPRPAHYACMVDLLSHSGNVEEGLEFVNNMPIEPDKRIWGALLAGCQKFHGSDVIAEIAARRLIDLDPENIRYYVFLSNLYAEQNRWEDVETVKQLVSKNVLRKEMGYSMIEACL